MAKLIGRGECHNCGRGVDVLTNVGGMAYYRCHACGVRVQHTKEAKSRKFLETVSPHSDDDETPEKPSDSLQIPEPPAPAPAPEKRSEKPKRNSIFMGL
ncbi:hypothetical protein [Cupriavidus sp. CuC1]|uniref:hypothetical protein n=1 Tax=Cupriavidus sp. CuC1 TaxID=3373131 RepID=UPI0037D30DFC